MQVEAILSGPATTENKKLLWRAWTALSEDTLAARHSLLEKILQFYMTDDVKDAFRTLSMLDSKAVLTQLNHKIVSYYRCWAHAVLSELDQAYAAFLQVDLRDRKALKSRLMELAVQTGDWRTGIMLWHAVSQTQTSASTNGWSRSPAPVLGQLLELIPNADTFQFVDVLAAEHRPAFKRITRRELVIHLARRGSAETAATILATAIADHEPIAAVEVGAIMSAMLARKDAVQAAAARDLYESARDFVVKPASDLYALAIKAHAAMQDLEGARRVYNCVQQSYSARTSALLEPATSMMAAYADADAASQVETIFKDYRQLGLQPDVRMLGTLMDVRLRREDLDGARELYDVGKHADVKFDGPFLALFASVCVRTLNLDDIGSIVGELPGGKQKLAPGTVKWTIDTYAARREYEVCTRLTREGRLGSERHTELTPAMIRLCIATDRLDGLQTYLSRVRENLAHTNLALQAMLCRRDSIDSVRDFVTDARQRGFKTSPTTVALLAHGAAMHDQVELGDRLLEMSRSFSRTFAEKTSSALILGYLARGAHSQAEDLIQDVFQARNTGAVTQTAIALALHEPRRAHALLGALLRDWHFDTVNSPADFDIDLTPELVVEKCRTASGNLAARTLTRVLRLFEAAGEREAVVDVVEHVSQMEGVTRQLLGPLSVAISAVQDSTRLQRLWNTYREHGGAVDVQIRIQYIRKLLDLGMRTAASEAIASVAARGQADALPKDLARLAPRSTADEHEHAAADDVRREEQHYVAARA